MNPLAHIGNIPVEEWAPFVVPVLALYIYGRRRDRRRAAAVKRLPDVQQGIDPDTIRVVEEQWAKSGREGVSPEHLPLLYPPGPDGLTTQELAGNTHTDVELVRRQLEELEELGYLYLDEPDAPPGPRVSLTFEGYDLLYETEAALLRARGMQRAGLEPSSSGLL